MTDYIIFKYPLDLDMSDNVIPMPEGAIILHVAAVNDQLAVWAQAKPDASIVQRRLSIVGTAESIPPDIARGKHVGSAVMVSGKLVVHVFDRGVA